MPGTDLPIRVHGFIHATWMETASQQEGGLQVRTGPLCLWWPLCPTSLVLRFAFPSLHLSSSCPTIIPIVLRAMALSLLAWWVALTVHSRMALGPVC